MPKIKVPATLCKDRELSFDDAVERFLIDCSARGLADKTLFTYRHHFQGMAHYLDMPMPLRDLRREHLNMMIVEMRANKLAANTISSYVRVITTFLHWCDREQLCHVEPPKFKQVDTVIFIVGVTMMYYKRIKEIAKICIGISPFLAK